MAQETIVMQQSPMTIQGTVAGNEAKVAQGTVVGVAAQPVVTVVGVAAQPVVQGVQGDGSANLLPHPEGAWAVQPCDKCCSCDGGCWMAWCCSCFILGQMASKMKKVGSDLGFDYKIIVGITLLLFVVDMVLSNVLEGDTQYQFRGFFLFIVLCQLRGRVRDRQSIPGDGCEDCCCSFWCTPCVTTQLMHQLWAQPAVVPGCNFTEGPADIP